jgi:hypothetical protein
MLDASLTRKNAFIPLICIVWPRRADEATSITYAVPAKRKGAPLRRAFHEQDYDY